MADWYTKIAEQVVGPLSADQLKALADAGRLSPSDPVARSKEGPWAAASRVKGLFEMAAIDDLPVVPAGQPVAAQVPPAAQPAKPEPPVPPFEQPPLPQPPVVAPKRTAVRSSGTLTSVEAASELTPPVETGSLGSLTIQTGDAAADRFHKRKRVRKPKQPLTKKQKNVRLVKWLSVFIVAGILLFACIPFLRRFLQSPSPATAAASQATSLSPADVNVDTTGKSLEETFGTRSLVGSRQGVAAAPRPAGRQPGPTELSDAGSTTAGPVRVKPVRVILDRPQMTSADGRTARPSKPYLLVEFELGTTAPGASVRFLGWLNCASEISLTDDRGSEYKVRTPGNFQGMFTDGQCREATVLTADKSTTDVIVFTWPDDAPRLPSASQEALKLRVPKSAYGEEGQLLIEIPLSAITVTDEAQETARDRPPAGAAPTSDNVEAGEGDEKIPIPGVTEKPK